MSWRSRRGGRSGCFRSRRRCGERRRARDVGSPDRSGRQSLGHRADGHTAAGGGVRPFNRCACRHQRTELRTEPLLLGSTASLESTLSLPGIRGAPYLGTRMERWRCSGLASTGVPLGLREPIMDAPSSFVRSRSPVGGRGLRGLRCGGQAWMAVGRSSSPSFPDVRESVSTGRRAAWRSTNRNVSGCPGR